MTTQRKTTGASALIDIMKEVYETKLRMKEVIKQKIDTNSDDFEEYATLAHNAIVSEYNRGIGKGYAAGWHTIFPSDQVTEDMFEEYYHDFEEFTPSIPTYTTDTDIDNLIVIMRDNLRCRLLLKTELNTNSDEFVTYPDLLEALYQSSYNDGYDDGFNYGIEDAIESTFIPPTIECSPWGDEITIINNADFGDIYYWIDDDREHQYLYTEPITTTQTVTIHAYLKYHDRISAIVTKECIYYIGEDFTIELLEDIPSMQRLRLLTIIDQTIDGNNVSYMYKINNGNYSECSYNASPYKTDIFAYINSLRRGDKIYLHTTRHLTDIFSDVDLEVRPCFYEGENTQPKYFKYNISGNLVSLINNDKTSNTIDASTIILGGQHDISSVSWMTSAYNLFIPYNINVDNIIRFDDATLVEAPKIDINIYQGGIYFRGGDSLHLSPLSKIPPIKIKWNLPYEERYERFIDGVNLKYKSVEELNITIDGAYVTSYIPDPELGYNHDPLRNKFSNNRQLKKVVLNIESLPSLPMGYSQLMENMFNHCSSLTEVEINVNPNVIFPTKCCANMFSVSNVNIIKCNASQAAISTNETPFYNWLGTNVSSEGTFVKKSGVTWPTGQNGIPIGWTVQEAA